MATLTPVNPTVTPTAITTITPTAADSIPCAGYSFVILVVRTGATNTYLGVIDDPNTPIPAGTLNVPTSSPDITTGTVPTSSARVLSLPTSRFRDANGNINITSASTFTGTTLEAYGI